LKCRELAIASLHNRQSKIHNPQFPSLPIQNRQSKIENQKSLMEAPVDEQEFKQRTKGVALRIIRLVGALPKTKAAQTIGGQLLRCGTSVGANYRAACRGKSTADMIAKLLPPALSMNRSATKRPTHAAGRQPCVRLNEDHWQHRYQ
jgi:hypothetical protein